MPLEKVERCPVCEKAAFTEFLTSRDFTQSAEVFHVKQCANCTMLVTSPRPSQSTASSYYLSANYISHARRSTGLLDSIYLIIRYFTVRWKLGLVSRYTSTQKLLDIGCGTGTFLNHAKNKGLEVYGVEPSDAARAIATSNSLKVLKDLQEVPSIEFSAITLWHVLEHVYDLEGYLKRIRALLASNGTVFIAVPNHESFDAKHYKEYWAAYDLPRHLWHFSKSTMEQLTHKCGLKVRAILPMKLDAYYVCLLSERYQASGVLKPASILKAVRAALKSNRRAAATMNYSSLIYVVQKA